MNKLKSDKMQKNSAFKEDESDNVNGSNLVLDFLKKKEIDVFYSSPYKEQSGYDCRYGCLLWNKNCSYERLREWKWGTIDIPEFLSICIWVLKLFVYYRLDALYPRNRFCWG